MVGRVQWLEFDGWAFPEFDSGDFAFDLAHDTIANVHKIKYVFK